MAESPEAGTPDRKGPVKSILLKAKIDELFTRWLNEPDTKEFLLENLQLISSGQSPTLTTPMAAVAVPGKRSSSPLFRSGSISPATPPCSPPPGLAKSPRSPRRRSGGASNKTTKTNNAKQPIIKKKKELVVKTQPQPQVDIPPFYFPNGRPKLIANRQDMAEKIHNVFAECTDNKAYKNDMPKLTSACGLPLYWKILLFLKAGGEKMGYISKNTFMPVWKQLTERYHDQAAQLIYLMAPPGRSYLVQDDFFPLIQDVVETHPGLTFLQEASEFHSRYIHTVIARIFYCVNRSWTGKITVSELRRSNLCQTITVLEEEEDINQITDYFSYEHFYVIYCKFWELDTDHDLYIDKEDLSRHSDNALSSRIIDQIFSGAVRRGRTQKEGKMSYMEFVWFLLSEEDKKNQTSMEYWFRCMDLDGDGVLSLYELEFFYQEQMQRMESLGIESLPLEDCLCQMLDMVKPREEGKITLRDLKECLMSPVFFDTFFNLEKYLEYEQRDPFSTSRDTEGSDIPEPTDWEKYAAAEYELLVAEESNEAAGGDPNLDELGNYSDDFEVDTEEEEESSSPRVQKGQERSGGFMPMAAWGDTSSVNT